MSVLALRFLHGPRKAELWAKLAIQHDGKDRWYLEALGIGAENNWDECLVAAIKEVGNPPESALSHSAVARDVFWRSRGSMTPGLLSMLLSSTDVSATDAPRFLRAFDFLTGPKKEFALTRLAFEEFRDPAKAMIVNSEAISRLSPFDIVSRPEYRKSMDRVLTASKGNHFSSI